MKTITCFTISFLITGAVMAQTSQPGPAPKRNTIFVELGGPASILYSVNYDRLLTTASPVKFSVQGGFSAYWWQDGAIIIPMTFNGFIGKGNHHFNLGLGGAYSYGREKVTYQRLADEPKQYFNYGAVDLVGRVGYRLQKPQGGFFFSAAYTPFFTVYSGEPSRAGVGNYYHWVGFGLGRTF